ncbi:twin-arginine translocation pathway signal protein [Flavobacterium zepuense]|uniref:Twin-arginine translocation pathway signal protein n=1 Tax=Flavobacterium zepuense TaxID=2593302 RepID=A0A552V7E9_9FLAO|nr:NAD(P)/FAD-dependent oxidoreductase [Flavobacterium zepuense]TRW26393.1 twin-arginine translocation pathway signal protein [Flavobacterium zepuense]
MKNGENYNGTSRRTFLKGIAASLLLAPFLKACQQKAAALIVKLTGTNHVLGHRLWAKNFPKPSQNIQIPYLIIGGGVSGLSAARLFNKKGIDDFLILEMESHIGGNSSNGENKHSKFPLGAHYLPVPNFHDKELLQFLEEEKIITGYTANGFPVFDEQQLSFSPQERLFYKNTWQEGLVPKFGNPQAVNDEFDRFFALMEAFRTEKGPDNRYYFDIPLSVGSTDARHRHLDTISMQQWLDENDFTSPEIGTYVNYCCRDDFGLGIAYISAWAGIHYFAARKHNAGDTKDNVLTWPEGNARLAHHLKKYTQGKTLLNYLAFDIDVSDDNVIVTAFDSDKQETVTITAQKVIIATPQFVNQYLLPNRKPIAKDFNYAPWLLATLTVSHLPDDESYPLCWDNVIFNGKGLGYIYDQHQNLKQIQDKKVITWYHSFSTANNKKARKELYSKSKEYWEAFVLSDLKAAHPGIENFVEEITIHRLGHGMISPVPGFLFGASKHEAAKSIANKLYFAHTDLSGISIFEEAFHQGINAVNNLLHDTAVDT